MLYEVAAAQGEKYLNLTVVDCKFTQISRTCRWNRMPLQIHDSSSNHVGKIGRGCHLVIIVGTHCPWTVNES